MYSLKPGLSDTRWGAGVVERHWSGSLIMDIGMQVSNTKPPSQNKAVM